MNHCTLDISPLEAAACRLLVAAMRASARPGQSVRFDYQHVNTRIGALIYTRIDRSDLRGPMHQLSTARHTLADLNARCEQLEQLVPPKETTPCA